MKVKKTRNVYNIDKPIYEFEILDNNNNIIGIIKIPLYELLENKADEKYILNKYESSNVSNSSAH